MNFTALRRRGISSEIPRYLMTMESNPQVFQICLDKGWCSAEGMTYQDARKVTNIPINTFSGNTDIVSFDELEFFTGLNNGLIGSTSTVSKGVFQDCTSLKSVKLPDNIKIIGTSTFRNCTSLTDVKIPNGVTQILETAFYITPLMRVEIPSTVTNIGYAVFNNSSNVQYVKVLATTPPTLSKNNFAGGNYPNAPIYVPDESVELYKAANNWSALASRIKPLSAFSEQYMMTTATNAEVLSVCYANGWCESPDYMTYAEAKLVDNDMFGTVFSGNTQITHFDEFENFTSITYLDNAFRNCTKLESIKVPSSLTTMGDNVFKECSVLKEITLPNVETVGASIFQTCRALEYADCPNLKTCGTSFLNQCYALKDVNLPLLETNGNSMLQYSSTLKKIVLPKLLVPAPNTFLLCNSLICIDMGSMNRIMTGVFSLVNLAQLIIRTPSVASLGSVSYINDTCWIYVPDDLVDSYKAANNWSSHASQIKPISEYVLYDSEVEYIESNGTQYINCNIRPKGTDILRCRVSIVNNSATGFILSAGYNLSNKKYSINVQNYTNYGSGGKNIVPKFELDTVYDITFGNNQLIYNGNTIGNIGSTTDFECGKVLTLFGESTVYRSKIRLYSFSLEDANGVKKLDMVPVRIGNRGYLYDKVSGELFCNNATNDTFAIGNDV